MGKIGILTRISKSAKLEARGLTGFPSSQDLSASLPSTKPCFLSPLGTPRETGTATQLPTHC